MKLCAVRIAALAFLIGYSFWNTCAYSKEARVTSAQSRPRNQVYIDNTRGRPPRENLQKALQIFAKEFDEKKAHRPLVAADLGAGAGNETIYLINKGWRVIAIDIDPYSIKTINERFQELRRRDASGRKQELGSLDACLVSMQKMNLEPNSLDLVNASFSLPFVPRTEMKEVWKKIVDALTEGGVFTGHFFGPEHAWRNNPRMSFYSVKEIFREFFDDYGFEIRMLSNTKGETRLGAGGRAFFHTITVIAQKMRE